MPLLKAPYLSKWISMAISKHRQLSYNNYNMTRKFFYTIIFVLICGAVFLGCGKDDAPTPTPVPPVTPPVTPPVVNKTCIISGISQRNSGAKAEFGMTVSYDNNLNPIKVTIFDSAANTSLFNATLTYASADSIRIDQYQYMKMDAGKRITRFVTKSDMTDIANADDYRYEYIYTSDGYLSSKNLYINGSKLPNYTTSYAYTNGLLTGCVMTATSAGNLKVLESTLSYDATLSPKTMIYTFPDAFESFYYTV